MHYYIENQSVFCDNQFKINTITITHLTFMSQYRKVIKDDIVVMVFKVNYASNVMFILNRAQSNRRKV